MSVFENINGKFSFGLGAAALLIILAAQFSPQYNDGSPGTVSYISSNIAALFDSSEPASANPEMKSIGLFPLTEESERYLLIGSSIIFSLLSSALAIIALTRYEYTLYPAAAMFSVFGGLVSINGLIAMVFAVVIISCAYYVQRKRKIS